MTSIGRHAATVLALAILLSGCALAKNTLAQDLAWQRWKVCEGRFPGVSVKEVTPDGQIWFLYSSGSGHNAVQECLKQAYADQARPAAVVAPPAPMGAAVSPSRPTEQVSTSAAAPVWKRGYEWGYRWQSPTGSGTFVWSVDREEAIGNVRAWVVKSGTRETYYSIPDLQILFETVDGAVETRFTPARQQVRWPITPGQSWEQQYVHERPIERQTEQRHLVCRVGDQESQHTIPAGTFLAYHIECRHKSTNALSHEFWYSPAVMNMIRDRVRLRAGGFRERELIEYRAK